METMCHDCMYYRERGGGRIPRTCGNCRYYRYSRWKPECRKTKQEVSPVFGLMDVLAYPCEIYTRADDVYDHCCHGDWFEPSWSAWIRCFFRRMFR